MNKRTRLTPLSALKMAKLCIILPICSLTSALAYADNSAPIAGIIDTPVSASKAPSVEQVKKQVSLEQDNLAKLERGELEKRATNGERLAQVALGADFADEAQDILFAPSAANAAMSDALAWYSLAAQRGYPGTRSLNNSGVKFHPIRVVRNKK